MPVHKNERRGALRRDVTTIALWRAMESIGVHCMTTETGAMPFGSGCDLRLNFSSVTIRTVRSERRNRVIRGAMRVVTLTTIDGAVNARAIDARTLLLWRDTETQCGHRGHRIRGELMAAHTRRLVARLRQERHARVTARARLLWARSIVERVGVTTNAIDRVIAARVRLVSRRGREGRGSE